MSRDLIIVTCYLRSQLLLKIIIDQHFYLCGGRPHKLGFILTIAKELRDSSGRHSGGRTPKILFVLSNGGSLTMTRSVALCGLLSQVLCVLHLIFHFYISSCESSTV